MNQVFTLVLSMQCASLFTPLKTDLAIAENEVFSLLTDEFENCLEKSSVAVSNPKVIPNQQHSKKFH